MSKSEVKGTDKNISSICNFIMIVYCRFVLKIELAPKSLFLSICSGHKINYLSKI